MSEQPKKSVEQHEAAPAENSTPRDDNGMIPRPDLGRTREGDTITFCAESVTLSGAQLLEALDFIAPDRDADQLECEVTIQHGTGHTGAGMYCWSTEYPEEGAILLDGAVIAQPEPPAADERAAPDVPEKRDATDPEQQWREFWQEICTNADGSINLEQVKKELSDFSMLLSWVPRVYMHVTGGRVSKVNTWPSVVISLHDEHVDELVEDAVRDELEARASSPNAAGAMCDHQWKWADGKCADCGAIVQQSTATTGMTLAERILHVGGRVTEAGCVEFGSAMAVDALIQHALRDLAPAQAAEPVVIYQILTEEGAWLDVPQRVYERTKSDPALARSVYASPPAPASYDGNHVENHCPECSQYESECECAPASAPVGLTEEQPSLTNPLTPYGMLVRALRIVSGTTLMDMAKALLTTPAKLSAMEFGRAPITMEFAFDVSAYFDALGVPDTLVAIRRAVDASPFKGDKQ